MRRGLTWVLGLAVLVTACAPIAPRAASPGPSAQAPASPRPATLADEVELTHVATQLTSVIAMANRPGSALLYFANQNGKIWSWNGTSAPPTLVLDITALVSCCGEQGLLGMAFNPAGNKLYVHFSSEPNGNTQVDEFTMSGDNVVPTPRPVLTVAQPESNHNGGSLLFSPADDLLYLALGDGGGANDGYDGGSQTYLSHGPVGNGQDGTKLLGKLLRIDPTDPDGGGPLTYTIPGDNPFTGASPARDEIWSLGLRNPYRMSFDRGEPGGDHEGDLWVGDVGQGQREEIDFVAIDDPAHPGGKGANFGWNRREGDIPGPDTLRRKGSESGWDGRAANLTPGSTWPGFIEPVHAPTHATDCAVIGGYVYRGTAIPDLVGKYVFTDLCNTSIRVFTISGGVATTPVVVDPGKSSGVSFGEDNSGELYLLSLATGVWKLT